MNIHAPKFGTPPLTPAERMECLIDAITRAQLCRGSTDLFAEQIDYENTDDLTPADRERMDRLLGEEADACAAVLAIGKTLFADNILQRCVEILRAETVGRP